MVDEGGTRLLGVDDVPSCFVYMPMYWVSCFLFDLFLFSFLWSLLVLVLLLFCD